MGLCQFSEYFHKSKILLNQISLHIALRPPDNSSPYPIQTSLYTNIRPAIHQSSTNAHAVYLRIKKNQVLDAKLLRLLPHEYSKAKYGMRYRMGFFLFFFFLKGIVLDSIKIDGLALEIPCLLFGQIYHVLFWCMFWINKVNNSITEPCLVSS